MPVIMSLSSLLQHQGDTAVKRHILSPALAPTGVRKEITRERLGRVDGGTPSPRRAREGCLGAVASVSSKTNRAEERRGAYRRGTRQGVTGVSGIPAGHTPGTGL